MTAAETNALVASAVAGDEAAFEAIYREHRPAMTHAAAATLRRIGLYPAWPAAEDAVQEAWIRNPLCRFRPEGGSIKAFLCGCARRAAIDVARKLVGKRLVPRFDREVAAMADVLTMPARTPQQDARLELSRLFSGRCKVAFPHAEKIVLDRWMRDEFASATCCRLGLSESRIFQLRARAIDRVRACLLEESA